MRSTFLHIPLVIFKKVTRVLAACALTACMGVANASSTYDFYWCDLTYGEVKGEIRGLEDILGDQAASSVAITSVNGDDIYNTEILGLGINIDNKVNVIDGEITELYLEIAGHIIRTADYAKDFTMFLQFSYDYANLRFYEFSDDCTPFCIREFSGSLDLSRRTVATVAEPGSVILLSLGLVGLAFSRYRKQS